MASEAPTDPGPSRDARPRTRTVVWGVVAVLAAVGLAFALSTAPQGDVTVAGTVALGDPAPDITMTDFDGERFRLSDYEGKPLVVNFWASWCPNCIAEMPEFEKVHRAMSGDIAFLGINTSDSKSAAKELARATGVTYRLASDPRGEAFQALGGVGMPATVFIDAAGNVVDVVVGQFSKEMLIQYVERSFPDHDVR